MNGGRGRDNNFTVNGGDGNDLFAGLPAIQPSPDAIEEFRVLTNTFDAEYGRNSGAVVNVVTKSGTNDFHGIAYAIIKNRVFDANNWFNGYTNAPPIPKQALRQNDFGGTLGGRIIRKRHNTAGDGKCCDQREASNSSYARHRFLPR